MPTDRIALVTGGMGGFGEAIAVRLHAQGYRVVVTHSLGNAHAFSWLEEQQDKGREFQAVAVDLADDSTCQGCVAEVVSRVGPVDILVNNAGITLSCAPKTPVYDRSQPGGERRPAYAIVQQGDRMPNRLRFTLYREAGSQW
ncbi:SDR family NAD(P)-dependent oxidoreductase [Ralstonia pseudosolanacearum]|uniref:SDR family NAD(P)-dependent oxidoreductase n=1 Tax=Ralstonia pseudosolanacearum TaxID=1310165 RepID=UPI003CF36A5C